MNRSWGRFGAPWTEAEDAVVRRACDLGTPLKLARKELPGRTYKAVVMRCRHLKLFHGYRARGAAYGLLAAGVRYMEVHRLTGVSTSTLNRIKKDLFQE